MNVVVFVCGLCLALLSACAHQGSRLAHSATYAPTHLRTNAPMQFAPIHFPTGGDRPVRHDLPRLSQHAGTLLRSPEAVVLLEGHADARGPANYNMSLGDRRARGVAALLLQAGVPVGQIMGVVSRGEGAPRLRGDGPRAWSANRRVEFVVR